MDSLFGFWQFRIVPEYMCKRLKTISCASTPACKNARCRITVLLSSTWRVLVTNNVGGKPFKSE
jgi:hypothetical protein